MLRDNLTRTWRYLEDDGVSAHAGLAADEYLMRAYHGRRNDRSPTLRLYTYRSHCALVGRFQNLAAEVDLEACRRLDVQVGRRPTGGGAILMGARQLGLCLVASAALVKHIARPLDLYRYLAEPVVRALDGLGIRAKFRPKNDLEVNHRKIAGLGVYFDPHGAMLFHTSLLVDLDLELMLQVLRVPREKLADKSGVHAVSERITTVVRETGQPIEVDEVRRRVRQSFAEQFGAHFTSQPWEPVEQAEIATLAREKYASPAWLHRRSPLSDMVGSGVHKTPAGLLRTYIGLKGDVIKSVLITGDFFEGSDLLNRIEADLKWSALERPRIQRVVERAFAHHGRRFFGLSADDVVTAIWKAGSNARAQSRLTSKGSCYYPVRSVVEIRKSEIEIRNSETPIPDSGIENRNVQVAT